MSRRRTGSRRARRDPARRAAQHQRAAARRKRRILTGIAIAAIIVAGGGLLFALGGGGTRANVEVPELGAVATRGAHAFAARCATCHGTNGSGTENGPPLVHRFYKPSHHDDAAIRRAVRLGVRPHHWRYGPMPKVDVSDRELGAIIAYIRELQRANGIR